MTTATKTMQREHEDRSRRSWRMVGAVLCGIGAVLTAAAALGHPPGGGFLAILLCFGPALVGGIIHSIATYDGTTSDIKNNDTMFNPLQSRGVPGWIVAAALIGFYTVLYFKGHWFKGLYTVVDPLSRAMRAAPADQWFLYGFLYTYAVILMAVRFGYRYRHNRYQLLRNLSVSFFQLVFAFMIPGLMRLIQQPEFYFTGFWPLWESYLYPGTVVNLSKHPNIGIFLAFWCVAGALVLVPMLTYFYGKRWYCSWVCGCGGLAETLGDPFRHLSDKSLEAWKIERWTIHSVLVIIVLGTALLWVNHLTGHWVLGRASAFFAEWYKYIVGSVLAGVVGVGLYALMGSRVWCRFFCPLAGILGIFQRFFSRFRITTNGSQCMSCGNCSTYCEMGIDVRSYAQRGDNIIRASCVGCGICAAVCPRGVLGLENGPTHKDRYEGSDKPLAALKRSLMWSSKNIYS